MKLISAIAGPTILGVVALVGVRAPVNAPSPPPLPLKPTYARDVAPILNEHCVACHRPNQVAPFSLIGYDNARKWSGMVSRVTHDGLMPPWKAESGYGEFRDENRLSANEREILNNWAVTGTERGDKRQEPKPPAFDGDGWTLGKPDLLLTPSRAYQLAADGPDVYRNFVMPTSFDHPVWVKAMDVRPGNAKIVHHVIVFLDNHGAGKKLEDASTDGQPGYSSGAGGVGFLPSGSLGGWAPGVTAKVAPNGVAFKVDPGESIVLQVHYHKSGKAEEDQTKVGLYFAKEPIDKELNLNWIFNFAINIPPNNAAYSAQREITWPRDATLYGVMPHMHLLGHSMKSWLVLPDGTIKPIINVPAWDFNWQLFYTFKQPIHVPAGTKQIVEAVYDNSTGNPNNPHSPPKRVFFGEQTTDEMFLMIMAYSLD